MIEGLVSKGDCVLCKHCGESHRLFADTSNTAGSEYLFVACEANGGVYLAATSGVLVIGYVRIA